MEKDWPKRPSDRQLQEAQKKDSDRAINPAVEAVCDPAHLAPPGSLQVKQLRHLHVQVSLGQRCHRQKKKKKSLAPVHAWSLQLYPTQGLAALKTMACQASLSEGIPQARIL